MKHNHQDLKKAQTTLEFLLGPIKIKDGLFTGDQLAAKDIEFIISNKVTHIINTVSKAIPNLYERFGVQYLSVHWTEKQQNIFDKKNNAVNAIYEFIEQAMEMGQSCLIHSMHGKSRSTAVLVAYLMKKYGWSLNKCLELVNSKKEGLQIRNNYLKQMQELQKRMMQQGKLSSGWHEHKNQEELMLANTFNNSKKPESVGPVMKKTGRKKVTWDQKMVQRGNPNANMSSTMTRFKQQVQSTKKVSKRVKSILKGFPNPHEDQPEQEDTPVKKQIKFEGEQKLINNISGNVVHVTVNNFITTDKKPVESSSKMYNSRPYSSDTKDREKKPVYEPKTNKMFGYDTYSHNLKNAYQQKLLGNSRSNPTGSRTSGAKKKQEHKPYMANERPSSANNEDIKKPKPLPFSGGILGKEEMMVTGSSGMSGSAGLAGKRRFPSGTKNDHGRFK